MYQAAGAYDMPVRFLDVLSAAGNGDDITEAQVNLLLPCYAPEDAHRLRALEMAMRECESLRYELEPIIERADEIMREWKAE